MLNARPVGERLLGSCIHGRPLPLELRELATLLSSIYLAFLGDAICRPPSPEEYEPANKLRLHRLADEAYALHKGGGARCLLPQVLTSGYDKLGVANIAVMCPLLASSANNDYAPRVWLRAAHT